MNTNQSLNPTIIDQLDKMPVAPTPVNPTAQRILDAYDVARAYVLQLEDPEHRKNLQKKLEQSNVRGSMVKGLKGADDVAKMLGLVTDWQEVVVNLKDKDIIVFQGVLPEEYEANTAYSTVREIDEYGGAAALSTIQTKRGYQKPGEYYHGTLMQMPTRAVTVQLKKDGNDMEHMHSWFAGVELASRRVLNDGDHIVRCGIKIQPTEQQHAAKMGANPGRNFVRKPYPHRDRQS